MSDKIHIGFFNKVHDKPLYSGEAKYTGVWDVCLSSNGRVIAYATTREDAEQIVHNQERIAELETQLSEEVETSYACYDLWRTGITCRQELEAKLAEAQENIFEGNSVSHWIDKAKAYGQGCLDLNKKIREQQAEIERLKQEISVLRQHGNKDCTAMADEVLTQEKTL